MEQETKKFVFVLGGPVNTLERPGIIIHCYAGLAQYPDYKPYVSIGSWTPDDPNLQTVIDELASAIGPKNRMKMYSFMEKNKFPWPIDNTGIPAWLSTFQVLYSTVEGTLIEYDLREVE